MRMPRRATVSRTRLTVCSCKTHTTDLVRVLPALVAAGRRLGLMDIGEAYTGDMPNPLF